MDVARAAGRPPERLQPLSFKKVISGKDQSEGREDAEKLWPDRSSLCKDLSCLMDAGSFPVYTLPTCAPWERIQGEKCSDVVLCHTDCRRIF